MTVPTADIAERVRSFAWAELHETLDAQGFAQTPALLRPEECWQLAALYERARFRSVIDLARHRFGSGEYKYFDHPLPEMVHRLREAFYPPLANAANRWSERLGTGVRYPPDLDTFLHRCHQAGQTRPTPLLLRYRAGDWNALHQDLYGEVAFPFQVVTLLERPGEDFEGGEFVLVEQRPRAQSRAHVCALQRGAFLIWATRERPVSSARGFSRTVLRHGVSTVTAGRRTTLGIIFHDAH